MADGDFRGRKAAEGYVACTTTGDFVIATLTFPTAWLAADGLYHIEAKVWSGTATGGGLNATIMVGSAVVDGGVVSGVTAPDFINTPTSTLVFQVVSGTEDGVQVMVTDSNGVSWGAVIEAYGFELAITPA